MSTAEQYEAAAATCGADPIEAGLIGNLADHECMHGRLPNDGTRRCGCWPEEGPTIAVVDGKRRQLPPQICREINALRRSGLTMGATVIVLNRYFHANITYDQVSYYVQVAGIPRPKVSKGRVVKGGAA